MTRSLWSAVGALALLAVLVPASASALDECRGLPQCVSVVGPWVVVPSSADGGLVAVAWELRCPLRGYVVGGTDARVTTRAIEVTIRGEKGSPVSPGVTTRRSVLFTARTAAVGGIGAFVPAIGCLPSDGGGGRSQTSVTRSRAVVQPGSLVRRVVTARVASGETRVVVAGCPKGSRLVEASHAVGFQTKTPPAAAVLGSVRATISRSGGVARVTATRDATVGRGARALVQVQAVCARGGS